MPHPLAASIRDARKLDDIRRRLNHQRPRRDVISMPTDETNRTLIQRCVAGSSCLRPDHSP